jgi:hypothetical protein
MSLREAAQSRSERRIDAVACKQKTQSNNGQEGDGLRIEIRDWLPRFLLGIFAFFLVFAPSLYDRLVARDGKSILTVPDGFPIRSGQVEYGVKGLDLIEDTGLYKIKGWAFVYTAEKLPARMYERQLVLSRGNESQFFATNTTWSFEIDQYYDALNIELSKAGFETLVYRGVLASGIYRMGIVLKQSGGGPTYFSPLDTCLKKTSNNLLIMDFSDEECLSLWDGIGQPITADVELPTETRSMKLRVERAGPSNSGGMYRVSGWVFLTEDAGTSAGEYERQVVLITSDGNRVFAADTAFRKDVQDYFQSLGMDLALSGFSTLVDVELIPLGIYRIGFLMRNMNNDVVRFLLSNSCLLRTGNVLFLEEVGSSACLAISPEGLSGWGDFRDMEYMG